MLRQSVYLALLFLIVCPSVSTSRASFKCALKILRSHGMSSDALEVIYKSIVLTKLLMLLAHGGLSPLRVTSNGLKHSCVEESGSTCTALSTTRYRKVWRILTMNSFCAVLTNSHHVLHHILPDRTSHRYTLRPRRHNCTLI